MHGFVDRRAVRGAEHRRRRRNGPEGARARCARVGCSTWMCCQPTPPALRSTGESDSQEANQTTASGARPFWLLFGAMPKSNPLAAGERKLCRDDETRDQMDSGSRRNDERKKSKERETARSARAQRGRLACQRLDAAPVAAAQQRAGRQPGSADANDIRQRQPLARAERADAAGRAETNAGQR